MKFVEDGQSSPKSPQEIQLMVRLALQVEV